MIKPLRRARALKAQKSRSVVKTLAAPTGGWNARDAIANMPETDAVAMVNIFPQTTDVTLRYGTTSQGHLGTASVGNAMLIDGVTGYATTPDTAAISVTGDIDLRAYANLDAWTTSTAQFFMSKSGSYQFFVLNGYLGALIYSSLGATAAFLSDTVVPVSNGSPLWVRVTVDIDNGQALSVATFYTGADGSTWNQLGGTSLQTSMTAIANTANALELGTGVYPSVTYQNPPLLVCDSAQFDGTNDYMTRAALTGAADSKSGILSFWIRNDDYFDVQDLFGSGAVADRFRVLFRSTNKFAIVGTNSAGTTILDISSTNYPTLTSGLWWNVLASWDLSTSTTNLYVNDVQDKTAATVTNDTLDYTQANWSVGANPSGGFRFNGCLAELYFAPGQYLDFSVTANRRRFISATGKPVTLGTNGIGPTGTAPIVYMHLSTGESPNDFGLNRATGGDFFVNGLLTTGSTSPSS